MSPTYWESFMEVPLLMSTMVIAHIYTVPADFDNKHAVVAELKAHFIFLLLKLNAFYK